MERILIVDDDASIGDMLEEMLTQEGYAVLRAYSGTEALLLLRENKPDLVLLDLMLPGLGGEDVLPYLKDVPVIVMSAKAGVDDKVQLLLNGAADYVTKPFSGKELMARIAVQLRMRKERQTGQADNDRGAGDCTSIGNAASDSASGEIKSQLKYGPIMLNAASGQCFAADKEIRLTRTEYAILKLLLLNRNQVVSRSALLDHIGVDTPDCTESSLKVHISHLRGKLREATGQDHIEAVWGIGFRLRDP